VGRKTAFLVSLGCGIAVSAPAFAAAAIPPASLVLAPSELPGFAGAKIKLRSGTSASSYAKVVLEEKPREVRKEVVTLKRERFREGVQELLTSGQGEALSLALVFASARAAQKEFKARRSEAVKAQGRAKVKRFTVAAIPGSFGFSASEPGHPYAAANVLFATGRCYFLVGNSLRNETPEQATTAPIAGATVLYQRVSSLCA
jgi:hypothetical protein